MKYNKVRGILRAKQGSQVPKFQMPHGPITNNNNIGYTEGLPAGMWNDGSMNYLDESTLVSSPKADLGVMTDPKLNPFNTMATNMKDFKIPLSNKNNPSFMQKMGFLGKGIGKKIGNFANQNQQLVQGGINMVSDKLFGGTTDSSEFNAIDGALGTLQSIDGPVGLAATIGKVGLDAINKWGARKIDGHTMNVYQKSKAGNYKGLLALNDKVEQDKNKEFGTLNAGGFDAAQDRANKLFAQLGTFDNIISTAEDQVAMTKNNIYMQGYNIQQNGGYDYKNSPRFTKQGGTLTQKINLVKSRKFNQVINVDTKQVEEFKEGGVFPCHVDNSSINYPVCELEWEPVIELFEEWEPEIVLEVEEFKDGGKTKEELETPEIEETSQKNLIPEGALHKNKHHMEHTEGLTQKGIPVIDNDGEQQAEIELDEIIFTLEVTKKLEELYKDGTDEAAIEAGKLLVKEILFNTDDRTGLISKCEKGGKL